MSYQDSEMSAKVYRHGLIQRGDFGGTDGKKETHQTRDSPEQRIAKRSSKWDIMII